MVNYKFKNIRGMNDFSDQFRKTKMHYKRIGYILNVMGQSALLRGYPEVRGQIEYLFYLLSDINENLIS